MAESGESSKSCAHAVCCTPKLLSFRRYYNFLCASFDNNYVLCTCVDNSAPRFQRLNALFSMPMTEVHLLFYQSVLQVFVHFNMFLQREDPLIPVIFEQMNSFLTKLASKFLPIAAIRAADEDFFTLKYKERSDQLPGEDIIINVYNHYTSVSTFLR